MINFRNILFISVFALLLAACSNSTTQKDCPDAEISYIDTLMINDIKYQQSLVETANENLPVIEKGKELGEVTYQMADNACLDHKMQNGDATYLVEDTIIYEVKGYPTSFLVTANDLVYVVDSNENAKTAGELYPIDNLVKNIHIQSNEDGKRLHTFSQVSKDTFVAEFTSLKLEDVQSLHDDGKLEGTSIFLDIELNNGVSFREVYWLDTNTFNNGAIGNDEIKEVIDDEVTNLKE